MITVLHVAAFEDNYIWLLCRSDQPYTVIVDPGDASPVFRALETHGLQPSSILCTHHHWDHAGGVPDLCAAYPGIPVYGPEAEDITGVTHPLREGDQVDLPELELHFQVMEVPGHTRGHIAYYGHGLLFCGDTLFSAGCGRLFEGTAEQMYASLDKLAGLADETLVYCAHEYTLANLRFAQTVEPANSDIQMYRKTVEAQRQRGDITLPSRLGLERRVNPFLRSTAAEVRAAAERHSGHALADPVAVFAAVRRWKDGFRG